MKDIKNVKNPNRNDKVKEIGIPKAAPKSIKEDDEEKDKSKGVKEGSKADIKVDKAILRKNGIKTY